jgi:3-isopropylmalate/(R)-2-methylmalate dehydratase small subunit
LLDFGIRCVISTSSPTSSTTTASRTASCRSSQQEDLDKLMEDARRGANATVSIDLEAGNPGPDGGVIKFDIDAFRKHCLLNGLDDIGLTLEKASAIDSYETKASDNHPWL